MRKSNVVIIAGVFIFLFSCSDAPPRLDYLEIFPVSVYSPTTGLYDLNLRVLAQVHDDDGYNSLESMYIVNDQRRLYWLSERDEWLLEDQGAENWILLPDLIIPHLNDLPGEYRAILVDSSGSQVERAFFIHDFSPDQDMHPVLRSDQEQILINSPFNEHRIRVYSPGGRFISSIRHTSEPILRTDLLAENESASIYIMNLRPENGVFYMSGPYTF
ncbi:hypothetical protein [Spirochaeta dissipatitropha]